MAIIANQTAPNFATGNYHRILRADLICGPTEPNPRYNVVVGFYASEDARKANGNPMYVHNVGIPLDEFDVDPRGVLYQKLLESELFKDTNAVSDA